jgi:hypothetical protein
MELHDPAACVDAPRTACTFDDINTGHCQTPAFGGGEIGNMGAVTISSGFVRARGVLIPPLPRRRPRPDLD